MTTLVWDLDPQVAATFYFRVKPKIKGGGKNLFRGKPDLTGLVKGTDFENLDLLPADFSCRHLDLWLNVGEKTWREHEEPDPDASRQIQLERPRPEGFRPST
ncbi:MAG: hypothetical protein GX751_01815 [Desulfuromonadaceae bacterium]|nr:hypothetical protein [Desulfuromonadaceae bacterium]